MSRKKETDGPFLLYLEKKLAQTNFSLDVQRRLLVMIDLVLNVVGVVILVLIIRTFIMSPFQVSGISMCNTLNYHNNVCHEENGDFIIINKSSYLNLFNWQVGLPKRGDVIVFRPPQNDNEYFIKRIIGLPEETIKLIDGYVYIYNQDFPAGIKLEEAYLNSDNLGNTMATGGVTEFNVPEGHYFVLGDNRTKSSDSRLCFKESPASPGCESADISPYLALNRIEGKAAVEFWPLPKLIETASYPQMQPNRR